MACSASSWWDGVAAGYYPPAIKLGPRTTAWRNADLLLLGELLETMTALDERAWLAERDALAARVRARGRVPDAWREEARAFIERINKTGVA